MKAKRDAALQQKNYDEYKKALRRIHDLKRILRRAIV
jgi:hypothetical protein